MLRQRAEPVAVEGVKLADLGEDLAGAAHFAGRGVFEHEHEQFVGERAFAAHKGGAAPVQLGAQRAAVRGQVGEAAAGQLGHFVKMLQV